MLQLVLLVFATFWSWETLRYLVERYLGSAFAATRPLHPFVVAALPLYVLWPDWVAALGVAGATGLLVAVVDQSLSGRAAQPVQVSRRRPGSGLPRLP